MVHDAWDSDWSCRDTELCIHGHIYNWSHCQDHCDERQILQRWLERIRFYCSSVNGNHSWFDLGWTLYWFRCWQSRSYFYNPEVFENWKNIQADKESRKFANHILSSDWCCACHGISFPSLDPPYLHVFYYWRAIIWNDQNWWRNLWDWGLQLRSRSNE